MPFAYYGAKHGLSAAYGPPAHRVLVEPFAGSAAYACRWAHLLDTVILNDADPQVVALWHRLQTITTDELDELEHQAYTAERTTDFLIASPGGGSSMRASLAGQSQAITPRMRQDWHKTRNRIEAALPYLRHWEIRQGSYDTLPDIEATWFIDPPYQSLTSVAGALYRQGAQGVDFQHLAAWCQSRRGQVIVCEQEPASWLPFWALRTQQNAANTIRTELVWRSDYQQLSLFEGV